MAIGVVDPTTGLGVGAVGGDGLTAAPTLVTDPTTGAVLGAPPPPPAPAAPPEAAKPKKFSGEKAVVYSPDGKAGEIPVENLEYAKQLGFREETGEQAKLRAYLEENKGIKGDVKAALGAFGREVTFGATDILAKKLAGLGEVKVGGLNLGKAVDPFKLAAQHPLEAEHELASAVGTGAGFAASLVAGDVILDAASGLTKKVGGKILGEAGAQAAGKVGAAELAYRAVEPSAKALSAGEKFGRTFASEVAKASMEGAILQAPQALTYAITGDPERAAEALLLGGALGGAFGFVGGTVRGALATRTAAGALENAASKIAVDGGEKAAGKGAKGFLGNLSDDMAWRSLNPLSKSSKAAERVPGGSREIGKMLREEGLLRESFENWNSYAGRVNSAADEAGAKVGSLWKQADDALGTHVMSKKELLDRVEKDVMSKIEGKAFHDDISKRVRGFVEELQSSIKGESVGFAELHRIRSDLQNRINFNKVDPFNVELKKFRQSITNELESGLKKIEEHFPLGGSPVSVNEIKDANLRFRQLAVARDAAIEEAERRTGRRFWSLSDNIQAGSALAGGMAAGGPLGAAFGIAGLLGNKILREEGAGAASRVLDNLSKGEGLRALEGLFAGHGEQLNMIPRALDSMASGTAFRAPKIGSINLLSRMIGNDGVTSPSTIADNLASLAADPARLQENLAKATSFLAEDAPQVATAAAMQGQAAVHWLASQMPKAPSQQLFGPKPQKEWSETERREFSAKLEIAGNPHAAVEHMARGTLTKAHVDALKALSPKLYQEMQRRVLDHGTSNKAKPLPYSQRLKLSQLLGVPLDRSLEQTSAYQASFDGGGAPQGGPPTGPKLNIKGPALQTDISRVSS